LAIGRRETTGRRNRKSSIRRDDGPFQQEPIMKNLILAAIATLSLGIGAAVAAPANTNTQWHLGSPNVPAYNFGGDGA
jgi:hypothetical protein